MDKYQNGSFRGFAQGIAIAIGTAALVAWLQTQFGPIVALGGLTAVGSIVLYQIGISNGANVAMNAIDRFVDALESANAVGVNKSKIALEGARADRAVIEADAAVQKKQNLQALDAAKAWAQEMVDKRDELLGRPERYSDNSAPYNPGEELSDYPSSSAAPTRTQPSRDISFVE